MQNCNFNDENSFRSASIVGNSDGHLNVSTMKSTIMAAYLTKIDIKSIKIHVILQKC